MNYSINLLAYLETNDHPKTEIVCVMIQRELAPLSSSITETQESKRKPREYA